MGEEREELSLQAYICFVDTHKWDCSKQEITLMYLNLGSPATSILRMCFLFF